jgi:hypothetical protein
MVDEEMRGRVGCKVSEEMRGRVGCKVSEERGRERIIPVKGTQAWDNFEFFFT